MVVGCVTIFVKPEHRMDFIKATIENHLNSINETGNLRFDFLECAVDPNRFFLYEAYVSEEASAAHKQTVHYLKWRDTVAAWMAKPREGILHKVISPSEVSLWK